MKGTIIRLLENRQGKENAITGKELARLLGERDDRRIRQIIRELIEEGYPIASSVTGTKGYFMTQTFAEKEEYLAVMRSRLIQDALRRRDYKKSAGLYLDRVTQARLI